MATGLVCMSDIHVFNKSHAGDAVFPVYTLVSVKHSTLFLYQLSMAWALTSLL